MRTELSLAWAGIRHRMGAWALLALGVALAVALPILAAGLRVEAANAAIQSAVSALPPESRTVVAVTSTNLRGTDLSTTSDTVLRGFDSVQLQSPRQSLTFRPLSFGGQDLTVGAVDRLDSDITVTDGRLPQRCRPTACEVIAVSPPGVPAVDRAATRSGLAALGLTVTGTAELTDQRLVGAGLADAQLPLVLSDRPADLAELEGLTLFGRNLGWYGTLDGAAIARQGVPAFVSDLTRLAATVNLRRGPITVTWPQDTVEAAGRRAAASADRFATLGAGAGALQLGFCLVVAGGQRRRQQLVARLLARRGASPAQLNRLMTIQPLIAVGVGLVVGVGVATGIVAARAGWLQAGGAGVGGVGPAAAAAVSVWPTLAVLSLAAIGAAAVMFRWPATGGRAARWLLNGTLVATVGLAVILLAGGTGTGTLPLVAISTLLIATGLLAARLWSPVAAGLHRVLARSRPETRVAVLVAQRRPLLRMLAAGFIAAACALLVFTAGYTDSLLRSAEDQSAFAVPLDVAISASPQVAAPLDVVDARRLEQLPGVEIFPVVSAPVSAFAGSPAAVGVSLIGVDSAALVQLKDFTAVSGASTSAAVLADRLRSADGAPTPTTVIPAGTRLVALTVEGDLSPVDLRLWVANPEGRELSLPLVRAGNTVEARIDPGPALTVRALEVTENPAHLMRRQHGIGEGSTDRALPTGNLTIGSVRLDDRPADWSWSGWGSHQTEVAATGPSLSLPYQLGANRLIIVPGFRTGAPPPLPVAVDPDTARRAGSAQTFTISLNARTVALQIVAVLPRMPTLGATYLVADLGRVRSLLDTTDPGTGGVSQVWLAAPGPALDQVRAVLDTSPARAATLRYRSEVARQIAEDPVAVRSILLLRVAGLVALLLALTAAATVTRADLAETGDDEFALELDGLPPVRLRWLIFGRTAAAALVGVAVGTVGGLTLVRVTVRLLVAGPGGEAVVPPLRAVAATPTTGLVVGAAVVASLLAAAAVAAQAFREPHPQSAEVDLR